MSRTYSELITIPTFKERVEYLKCTNAVGEPTFGSKRWLNQVFYHSNEWKKIRDKIIFRDQARDLAFPGHEIVAKPMLILIHHIEPITEEDIYYRTSKLTDPENLVLTIHSTHNIIHYGDISQIIDEPVIRRPNDQCPWKM